MRKPYYLVKCPSCSTETCYLCKIFLNGTYRSGACCVNLRFMSMIFQDGFKYIDNQGIVFPSFKAAFIRFIIPLYNLWLFIGEIHTFFYYA